MEIQDQQVRKGRWEGQEKMECQVEMDILENLAIEGLLVEQVEQEDL